MVSPPQVNKRYNFSATSEMKKKKLFLTFIGISVLHKDKNLKEEKQITKLSDTKTVILHLILRPPLTKWLLFLTATVVNLQWMKLKIHQVN